LPPRSSAGNDVTPRLPALRIVLWLTYVACASVLSGRASWLLVSE
jgi:hypothetical protein